MIEILNRLMTVLFDGLMRPWMGQSPWPAMIVGSLVTAVVLVLLFRVSSNAEAIRQSRNRLLARTLELLMFQHDLRISLSACGRILWANAVYLYQFLRPMAVGILPLLLIFAQLESWFQWRPLHVGERTVLTVDLDASHPVLQTPVELSLSDGFQLDSSVVRIPSTNQMAWRIRALQPELGWGDVKIGEVTERKTIVSGEDLTRLSAQRSLEGQWTGLLSPSETSLAVASPIKKMQITYPTRELSVGETEVSWIVASIGLMMVLSLLLGRIFGIRLA
jgi:hypothetical protein